MTPTATRRMPTALYNVNSSPYKIRAKITIKMGEVIEINARFNALVVCPPRYSKVLNKVTPVKAVMDR